jgi:hypothetical protein
MKLCAVSESLGHLSFKEAARASADLGLAGLEIGMGNWSAAPHADGLPAGGPNDVRPNWVTCAWPPENREILDWQWNEKLLALLGKAGLIRQRMRRNKALH